MAMHLRMRLEEVDFKSRLSSVGNIYLFLPTHLGTPTDRKISVSILLSCAAAVPKTEILKAACGANAITFLSPMTWRNRFKLAANTIEKQQ